MIDRLRSLDEWLFLLVNNGWSSPALDGIMTTVTTMGDSAVLVAAGLVLILLWDDGKRWRMAMAFLLTMAIAGLTLHAAKWAIPRDRPIKRFERVAPDSVAVNAPFKQLYHRSFPSGHSQAAFTAAAFFALAYRRRRAALYGMAAAIAFSRVYIGVHFPSDIIAGSLLGWVMAWLVWRAWARGWLNPTPG